ncbi:hypothetical protein IQ07DRAFT_582187 [Pyrenochaeta sp. DS3sAY3a]|nr:hypothetical protein IQ07DRAFT_582187 [Pyrenochaeta sp. DS3sAY3a]
MLRAAYFGQELLSTFSNQIGEISLIPATGGLFTVELTYIPPSNAADEQDVEIKKVLLWDRKAEGGFPETKVLKQRVRDYIDPSRDLGHSDKHGKKKVEKTGEEGEGVSAEKQVSSEDKGGEVAEKADVAEKTELKRNPDGTVCEDCR